MGKDEGRFTERPEKGGHTEQNKEGRYGCEGCSGTAG